MRESFFEGKLLLAETYCYNLSGRQDSNLRPSAPKTPHRASTAVAFLGVQLIANNLLFPKLTRLINFLIILKVF